MRALVAVVLAAALLGGCRDLLARTLETPALDRSHLVRTFDEEFAQPPAFWSPEHPEGRWKTNYFFGVQDAAAPDGWQSRTIAVNGEQEFYAPPDGALNPFAWHAGELAIVARPNPAPADPRTHGLPYVSGLMTTERSFSQRYGYFEARVALPQGKGVWPAFWLLPVPQMVDGWAQSTGQQEVDVFETIGEPQTLYMTDFSDDGGAKVVDDVGRTVYTQSDLTQFHNYGVLVTPTDLVWYFDDHEVRRRPNRDFHRPAYMLLNLAIGGNWPGAPDGATAMPARMRIAWVRAWRLAGAP